MPPRITRLQRSAALFLVLIVVSAFLANKFDAMWSGSVDLAHHYALAYRISEQGLTIGPNDPTLGEMNVYPRAAHAVAAGLGRLLGSTFLGLHLTSLIALATIWMAFVLILHSLPRRTASIALVSLAGLVALSTKSFNLDLHGHEIIDNFFYSQLVGEALLYVGIAIAIAMERRVGTNGACIALIPLTLLLASTHLLPALLLLGLLIGLQAVQVLVAVTEKNNFWRTTVSSSLIVGCATGLIFLHPSFPTSSSLAGNDGRLEISLLSYPTGVIAAALVLLLTSTLTFMAWWRSEREAHGALKNISLLGLACAALCIAQFVLSRFGFSSDYAVKKFIFCILSLLALQISAILGFAFSRWKARHRQANLSPSWLYPVLPGLSLGVILACILPTEKWLDVSDIAQIERQLIATADSQLPVAESGKSNVVIGVYKAPAIDYMFSLAIAKTPRQFAVPDVLIGRDLTDFDHYSYILTSSTNALFGSKACKSFSHGPFSIIQSDCASAHRATMQSCFQVFDFSVNGTILPGMIKGFDGPEQDSRWTEGKLATFTCSASEAKPVLNLRMDVVPFLYGALTSQRLVVVVNGITVYSEKFTWDTAGKYQVVIPLPSVPRPSQYRIEFHMPDATSPAALGASADGRQLGFSFRRIIFD